MRFMFCLLLLIILLLITYNVQNKTSSKLTEISQDRDSIERELKDAFSLQEETVKKLQDEVDHQKVNVYCVYLAVVYLVHVFSVHMYLATFVVL